MTLHGPHNGAGMSYSPTIHLQPPNTEKQPSPPGIIHTQRLDYHCYTIAGDYTWTYVRNDSTGVSGWIRDDLLSDYGSSVYCGF
jgi:hypothetical protein